ncbi:DUF3307 domain-containing protein [Oricola sp.]|uniref:DUF3307 domain-containing protein n=1 Tax=Oricola sp. TaxID=1979950 RepID=UPI003BAA9EB2
MSLVFALFIALLIKHYFADFVFQPAWMLSSKGSLTAPGGYAHAAFHAAGSGALVLIAGVPAGAVLTIMAAEFVVHFLIDFAKDRITEKSSAEGKPSLYWQLHGFDQLLHQLTYVGITYYAMISLMA